MLTDFTLVPLTRQAHYRLIKQMVQVDEWRMISDNDPSIMTAFFRVFSKEVRMADAHHFLCLLDKNKSRKQCLEEFDDAKSDLLDWGFHRVNCTTDLSSLEPKEIAILIKNVNDNATNSFIQQIRRRLSILERPLMTARGDGKSYIYKL